MNCNTCEFRHPIIGRGGGGPPQLHPQVFLPCGSMLPAGSAIHWGGGLPGHHQDRKRDP
jgi:hypothetical protein